MSLNRFPIIGGTILLCVTCFVYSGTFWNDFVEFDDNLYVTANRHTAAGLTPANFIYAWTTIDSGNWIPLTWLSLQLDATIFGLRPGGFHATNVVLHTLNVILLFLWLVRTTGSKWRSFTVAILFALHPLHVESVAWIAERKDVLSTFWLLITLLAYERYVCRPSLKWYLATLTAFLLGLLSKSMLVTLPVLLLLVDFWPLQRFSLSTKEKGVVHRYFRLRPGYLFLEKIPFFGLSLADGIMTIAAQSHSTAFKQSDSTLDARLIQALHSYGWYFAKTFVPTELMLLYPRPPAGPPTSEVAGSIALLIIVSTYVLLNRRRQYLVFGWFWYLISLLPVIGLLQVGLQAHADRYTYVPHIGLFVMIVWELGFWLMRVPAHRVVAAVALILVAMVSAVLTIRQVAVWRNTESIWRHVVSIDKDNDFAHGALAVASLEAGQIDEAVRHFDFVIKRHPEKKSAIDAFVDIYRKYSGRPEDQSEFLTELGIYYAREKSMELARNALEKAVRISPDNTQARFNLGLALATLGQNREAISQFELVLAKEPANVVARVSMGILQERAGQLASAREQLLNALKYEPGNQTALSHLRDVNRRLGQP